jgi:hypothetical protein
MRTMQLSLVSLSRPQPALRQLSRSTPIFSRDFNVEFDLLELELGDDLGFIRTRSHGTIVPKGQKPAGSEGNREIFIVKKIQGAWKFYRYIFNSEVAG